MREVVDIVDSQAPFASIDIHNNTGNNPHYACLNRLDDTVSASGEAVQPDRGLFQQAGRGAIGGSGRYLPGGDGRMRSRRRSRGHHNDHAGVHRCGARLSQFPLHPLPETDLDLLRTFAIITVYHRMRASQQFVGYHLLVPLHILNTPAKEG